MPSTRSSGTSGGSRCQIVAGSAADSTVAIRLDLVVKIQVGLNKTKLRGSSLGFYRILVFIASSSSGIQSFNKLRVLSVPTISAI